MHSQFLMSNSSSHVIFNKQPSEYDYTVLSGKINATAKESFIVCRETFRRDQGLPHWISAT